MQRQLHENLKDVAVQNQITIENLLNSKQDMLRKIADQISDDAIEFHSEEDFWMVDKMVEDKQLVDSFKSAIENNEFEIWYQPKYSANTSQMMGAEALV